MLGESPIQDGEQEREKLLYTVIDDKSHKNNRAIGTVH